MDVLKIVGVGGITNQMLPELGKRYPEAELILIDGDDYERKNLERQAFAKVGGNKAIVTAHALNDMGISARAIPVYVTPENINELVGEGDRVLLAVDNHRSRKLFNDRGLSLKDFLLISGGNELKDGGVQIMWRTNGIAVTPPLTYCHPEIEHPDDKGPFERGCLEIARSQPQIAETNLAVGMAMLEAYADFLANMPVAEIYVSIEPFLTSRKVLPQERGWIAA